MGPLKFVCSEMKPPNIGQGSDQAWFNPVFIGSQNFNLYVVVIFLCKYNFSMLLPAYPDVIHVTQWADHKNVGLTHSLLIQKREALDHLK